MIIRGDNFVALRMLLHKLRGTQAVVSVSTRIVSDDFIGLILSDVRLQ